ncbi:hypothetical protein K2X85_20930 [bacterium]|nr:hypothetical protein [bacterium]
MSTEGLSNLVALETIWKQGFSIVARRIRKWLDTKGVKHNFEMVDVPPGTRINQKRTDFRRLWERLPVEWELPEIGQKIGF